ncbi:MAG: NAD(P)-binding domain-containing protein [Acidobacteriota bacterium]
MKLGILGSGDIGGALGQHWAREGHEVFFSSRHPETLDALVAQAGSTAQAGTVDDALAFADVLLEAIPFHAAMELPPSAVAGKIVLQASNYYPHRDGAIDLGGLSQSEAFARRLPGARVVKVFNMMFAGEMTARLDNDSLPRWTIFLAGDDLEARSVAAQLVEEARFTPVDAGALAEGRHFETDAPLYAQRLSEDDARQRLAALRRDG